VAPQVAAVDLARTKRVSLGWQGKVIGAKPHNCTRLVQAVEKDCATLAMVKFSPVKTGMTRGTAMKNLFERGAVDEVVSRIDQLQPGAQGQWGKMDVAQMMAHCSAALDMASGRINPPRIFLGRLIGALVKPIYTNEKPFSQNNPTDKALVVSDQRIFRREQEQLRSKLRQFHEGGEAECTRHPHPFFGALTPQQWARGMYKHMDHHLRQFGA
jgi:hypothetical protein